MTAQETKLLSDSLDVENMDANLFGSFNRKKKPAPKKANQTDSRPPSRGVVKSREPEPSMSVKGSSQSSRRGVEGGVATRPVVSKTVNKTVNKPPSTTFSQSRDEGIL